MEDKWVGNEIQVYTRKAIPMKFECKCTGTERCWHACKNMANAHKQEVDAIRCEVFDADGKIEWITTIGWLGYGLANKVASRYDELVALEGKKLKKTGNKMAFEEAINSSLETWGLRIRLTEDIAYFDQQDPT